MEQPLLLAGREYTVELGFDRSVLPFRWETACHEGWSGSFLADLDHARFVGSCESVSISLKASHLYGALVMYLMSTEHALTFSVQLPVWAVVESSFSEHLDLELGGVVDSSISEHVGLLCLPSVAGWSSLGTAVFLSFVIVSATSTMANFGFFVTGSFERHSLQNVWQHGRTLGSLNVSRQMEHRRESLAN